MTNAGVCGGDEQSAHVESISSEERVMNEGAPPRGRNRSGLVGPLTDHTARGGTYKVGSPFVLMLTRAAISSNPNVVEQSWR